MSRFIHSLGGGLLAVATVVPVPGYSADRASEMPAAATPLKQVTVTATRGERDVYEVPASVSVLDRDALDDTLTSDLRDVFRDEPGVAVNNRPARFGAGSINIRGLEGNRVIIVTDGVRTPDFFSFGPFFSAGRDYTDLETVQSVEILRGPSSALYGSDALGGVVSFTTPEPEDITGDAINTWRASVKPFYTGVDDGAGISGRAAWRGDVLGLMLVASTRRGGERDNQGAAGGDGRNRTLPNPQDTEGQGLLAKITLSPGAAHRFTLSAEHNRSEVQTDMRNQIGNAATAPGFTNTSFDADDSSERTRYSLAYRADWKTPLFDRVHATLYTQDGGARQDHIERRTANAAPAVPRLRVRSATFDQNIAGLALQLNKSLQTGGVSHLLTYGVDHSRTRTEALRSGSETNLATGLPITVPASAAPFQTRDFPNTDTTQTGLFVQDEMFFPGGKLSVTPALRYDRHEMTPRVDALFAGAPPAGLKDTAVTPRLGVMYAATPLVKPYANYALGFRAPNYSEVNSGFTNLAGGYTTISNPDLKAETSRGVEIGVKGADARLGYQLAAFDSRYRDFIESVTLNCPAPVGNPARDPQCSPLVATTFQNRNLAAVRIVGVEARAEYRVAQNWRVRGNLAWHRGTDESRNQPLASINPARANFSLAYTPGIWGVEAHLTAAAKNDRVNESGGARFKAPAWQTLDLTGFVKLAKDATLRAGVYNLSDEKYWHASDVRGLGPTEVALDRFTQPGINASVSAQIRF